MTSRPAARPSTPAPVAAPRRAPVPGATNPAVTQATIGTTICVAGWTATVRPPSTYTSRLKRAQLARLGYADKDPRHYEEDHLVPLALGGAPRDPRNLWPEPWPSARVKDSDERDLHRKVCAGTLTLARAQALMLQAWGPH